MVPPSARLRDGAPVESGLELLRPTRKGPALYEVRIPTGHPYLVDHKVRGFEVLAGMSQIEMVREAARMEFSGRRLDALEHCIWRRPLMFEEGDAPIHLLMSEDGEGTAFRVRQGSVEVSSGVLRERPALTFDVGALIETAMSVRGHPSRRLVRDFIYRAFSRMGIDYGPQFRLIEQVAISGDLAFATLAVELGPHRGYAGLLDCTLQAGMCIAIGEHEESLMPFSAGSIAFHADPASASTGTYHVAVERKTRHRGNFCLFNAARQPVVSIFDLGVRPSKLQGSAQQAVRMMEEVDGWRP